MQRIGLLSLLLWYTCKHFHQSPKVYSSTASPWTLRGDNEAEEWRGSHILMSKLQSVCQSPVQRRSGLIWACANCHSNELHVWMVVRRMAAWHEGGYSPPNTKEVWKNELVQQHAACWSPALSGEQPAASVLCIEQNTVCVCGMGDGGGSGF